MSEYFILEIDFSLEPTPGLTRIIDPELGLEPFQWMGGSEIPSPNKLIQAEIYRGRGGMPEIFLAPIPLFREDVLESLRASGASNFQSFPARIFDTERNREYCNYRAINIVGCVDAADLVKSNFGADQAEAMHTSFRRLVIDPQKAGGILMFRLYHSINKIIIHERVVRAFQNRGFKYMRYIPA
jgi:hypothetical protein